MGEDGYSDDVSRHTAGSAKVGLLTNVNIWHVLVFAEKWQMEDDLEWLGISSKDDKIGNTSVECFGCFVSTLLEELEILRLIEEIQNLLLHLVVSLWPSSRFFDGIL